MAAPAFRSAGTMTHATSSSTPGAPAGAADGDILILWAMSVADDVSANTISISANGTDWNEITGSIIYQDTGSNAIHGRAWWYRVSGSVPTMPTITQTSIVDGLRGVICAYSGCVSSGTPYEAVGTNSGSSATPTGVAVTTTDIDRLVLNFFGINDDRTGTPASGWTENSEQTVASPAPGGCIVCDSITKATAGTQAAPSRTISLSENYAALGLALIPDTGASGVTVDVPVKATTITKQTPAMDMYVDTPTKATTITKQTPALDLILSAPTKATTITKQIPDVVSGASVDVPVKATTITPLSPTLEIIIFPGAKGIAITPNIPEILATPIIDVPAKSITLSPLAPTLEIIADIPAKSVTFTKHIPEMQIVILPGVKALSITIQTPSIDTTVNIEVPVRNLTLGAQTPTIVSGVSIDVPTKALIFTKQNVAVDVAIAPGAKGMSLTTYNPTTHSYLDVPIKSMIITNQTISIVTEPSYQFRNVKPSGIPHYSPRRIRAYSNKEGSST